MPKPLILVVESDLFLKQGIGDFLELNDYEVLAAEDGVEALDLLQALDRVPDLILCDTILPRMNSYEFLRQVRSHPAWAAVACIFLFIRVEREELRQLRALGAEDFLEKPFDAEDLLALVRSRLDRARWIEKSWRDEPDQDDQPVEEAASPSEPEEKSPAESLQGERPIPLGGEAALPAGPAPVEPETEQRTVITRPESEVADRHRQEQRQESPPQYDYLADEVAKPKKEELPPAPEPAPAQSGQAAPPPPAPPVVSVAPLDDGLRREPPPPDEAATATRRAGEGGQPAETSQPQPVPMPRPASAPGPRLPVPELFGGLRRRERAVGGSAATVSPAEPPHFTAYYPQAVLAGQPYALMAFAHLDSAWEKVRQVAAGYAGLMGDRPQSGTTASTLPVSAGALITFVPRVTGIQFNPREQVCAWQPPYVSATFLFAAPVTLTAPLAGVVQVYLGPLILGEIPVSMALAEAGSSTGPSLDKTAALERLDPVFASYSHRDSAVMEYFRRIRQNLGQRMLVDVYDLRSGEHWADRLLEMIDQSAVFQLFWSRHSATSTYCRQEWQHALRCAGDRARFIQPVWWQSPMPVPPSELANLHFQRIALPPLTRAQMALAQVRRLFG